MTRLRSIFKAHVVQQQRHDVENVASAGASPAVSTIHGPKLRQRSSRLLTGIAGCMSLWTDHSPPVGETASRLAYIQKSRGQHLHGRPYFAAVRTEFLRSKQYSTGCEPRHAGANPAEMPVRRRHSTSFDFLRNPFSTPSQYNL